MKVGILTYHKALNYGACLQAIATRYMLEKLGHTAYFIDYWPDYHRTKYEPFSFQRFRTLKLKHKISYAIETIRFYRFKLYKYNNYLSFFKKYITPYCKPLDTPFDVVIYGSDQIWRYQYEIDDYNPVYFANNTIIANKHIAFSASMGVLPNNKEKEMRVKSLVTQFDKIAVRENDLLDLLATLNVSAVKTLDPTLLLSKEEWNAIIPTKEIKQKYLLVYGPGAFNMKSVREFATKHGMVVKILLFSPSCHDTETIISNEEPTRFIELFKNATFVLSSSFHGLAFSIIYMKDFFVSYETNSNRASTLLQSLNLSSRMIKPHSEIPDNLSSIDYGKVNALLAEQVKFSLDYLANI